MLLENTIQSVRLAKEILGIPSRAPVGLRKVNGDFEPVLEKDGRKWYVGDEVLPE